MIGLMVWFGLGKFFLIEFGWLVGWKKIEKDNFGFFHTTCFNM